MKALELISNGVLQVVFKMLGGMGECSKMPNDFSTYPSSYSIKAENVIFSKFHLRIEITFYRAFILYL